MNDISACYYINITIHILITTDVNVDRVPEQQVQCRVLLLKATHVMTGPDYTGSIDNYYQAD